MRRNQMPAYALFMTCLVTHSPVFAFAGFADRFPGNIRSKSNVFSFVHVMAAAGNVHIVLKGAFVFLTCCICVDLSGPGEFSAGLPNHFGMVYFINNACGALWKLRHFK